MPAKLYSTFQIEEMTLKRRRTMKPLITPPPPPIQMNQKGLLSKIDLQEYLPPTSLYQKGLSVLTNVLPLTVYNRKINALNTFCCYASDCSLLPFDLENHHFCFRHTQNPPLWSQVSPSSIDLWGSSVSHQYQLEVAFFLFDFFFIKSETTLWGTDRIPPHPT